MVNAASGKRRSRHKRSWFSLHRLSRGPEVNEVDHVIRSCRGATIAPTAMHPEMQAAKYSPPETDRDLRARLVGELDQHQQENQFYGACYDLYHELRTKVSDIAQKLILQSYFEPESPPAGDPFLHDAIRQFSAALQTAQAGERNAEEHWKQYWNVPPAAAMPATWI
ncbi:uncharacterized protein AKAW2_30024A [Aspergillus luchuensis]|uniref:Uncharacterized protein n=2 Tax=Aspergillus kawachii TaxID=1069201 RepID=A0A7R7W5F5_ASPKA|nr:uncharacterized protein AKAW2_30024A [Aspergillus luchuensis]BCR96705.1 hypothetical protein AKAW2_30024A [Aspergillus luchuensis]BCS09204.1 hypothetical protein ALUC_30021A [Aspergillus luchuensis]GAA93044.1 hypothetical protein AKAW_11156 [Aspergillus luchuensis IFO 4308]